MRNKYIILASCLLLTGCFGSSNSGSKSTYLQEIVSKADADKRLLQHFECLKKPDKLNICPGIIANHSQFGACVYKVTSSIKGTTEADAKYLNQGLDNCYAKYTKP